MANLFSRLGGLVKGGVRGLLSGSNQQLTGAFFADMTPEEHQRMERQRRLVLAAASALGAGPPAWLRNKSDLAVLQRIVDERLFAADQTNELQALGVVLGDVMETELGLKWVVLMDELGAEPVLRFKATSQHIKPLTILSQRVASGGTVNLIELVEELRNSIPR